MANVRVIPALDQDGSQLWQHQECEGVASLHRINARVQDPAGVPTPMSETPCPMCGEPGDWWPLYRPASKQEAEKIDRRGEALERAARQAVKALNKAL